MGHQTLEFFRDHGVTSPIEVIPGGIDGRRYRASNADRIYDVIFVGRLTQIKRIDLFLETVRDLLPKKPEISAVVVGSGELDESLKNLTKRLGVEQNVTFAGYQQDVSSWLAKSKVFVLTSDSEGLSLALMEAMMSGLPCVVSDVGELGELIKHGTNGFLVNNRSSRVFAQYIALLLQDSEQYAKFAAASRRAALRFELAETTKTWDRVLKKIQV
jgi:glycosyltransferase involved in cell wall biosynthesis